ncbi:MAG: LptF/LptG family permease [Candidatus Binataceae bacterium]
MLGFLAMGVGLLTFTFVADRMLKLTRLVVNQGGSVSEVLGPITYILPVFLELTLGMAMLVGVLLGFGWRSNDQEMPIATLLFVQDKGNPGRGLGDILWAFVERYEKNRAAA